MEDFCARSYNKNYHKQKTSVLPICKSWQTVLHAGADFNSWMHEVTDGQHIRKKEGMR